MDPHRQPTNNQQQQQQEPRLRSRSGATSMVQFINKASVKVSVFWIDYQGKPKFFAKLEHNTWVDINTYVNHPWVFVDEFGESYLANGKPVYFPEPNPLRPAPPPRIERIKVYITSPMFSLRKLCLRAIKRRLCCEKHAFQLEIPFQLRQELYDMYRKTEPPRNLPNST